MADYLTLAEVKSSLSLTGESFADADLTLAITAASRGIDKATNRRFYPDADANTVRYYSPDSEAVPIDDLAELTALEVRLSDGLEVWTENGDFILTPLNAPVDNEPWTMVEAYGRSFPRRPRSVKITGRFGWGATPAQIKEATSILTSKLMRRIREAPFGVVSFDSGEALRIARMDPDVRFLIEPFRHIVVA